MGLPRSSSYYRVRRRHREDEEQLVTEIERICERFPGYGYRRVTHQLRREGWLVNHKRVSRVMSERGLQASVQRRYVATSDGGAEAPYENLARYFVPDGVNQLWVADITYSAPSLRRCH